MDNIIAIIPARGGSKEIPHKNVRNLCDKPLIAWTIEQGLKCKYLDKIIVSTDDHHISEISKQFGAQVPFLRPKEISKDDSSTVDAVIHALNYYEINKYKVDIVVILQPTSPLRTSEDISMALKIFFENKDADSVVSVSKCNHSPYWSLKIENKFLKANFGDKYLNLRRQDLPDLFLPNGAIYISSKNNIQKNKGFFGKRTMPYVMPYERSIDIDSIIDLKLAEILLGERDENY